MSNNREYGFLEELRRDPDYREGEKAFYRNTKFKDLEISECIDKSNNTSYYTIINPKNGVHVHVQTYNSAINVCKCVYKLKNNQPIFKASKYNRKQAMRLLYNFKFK